MQIWKRFAGICLAAAMLVTGIPIEGLALQAEAAPNTSENAYLGVMLTEEEFDRISYTNAEVDWCDYVQGENENGLVNYEARYMTDGATVNSVLENLKERDKFYRQPDEYEEGEQRPTISGDDGKADEGYYAVFAVAKGTTAQAVTIPEGVKGVLFDTHYYNELPEDAEADENTEWFPYTYNDLTVEAKAPLTFRGHYADITVKSGTYSKDSSGKEYPIVMKGEAAGSIKGVAENGVKNSLYIYDASLYGISGFSKSLFLPQTWRNDETGEEGIGRWINFNSPTGEEKISFESICNADLDENGMPREIAEEEEATAVSLNMRYHRGYIPEISGSSNLGIWKGTNEETGEEETGFNNIDVNYYDVIEGSDNTADHIFEPGAQVVAYKSAAGWSSHVWYNSPETEGERVEYRIDAQGCLYREVDRKFRVNRYQSQAEYDAYQENGQWGSEDIGEAATIAGALQMLAYDSELNADSAYYTLGLIQDWDNKPNDKWFWETELGNLSIPETVKGLRLTAEGQDTENGFRRITGTLIAATVNAGTELELTGWYKGADGNIQVSGGGKLGLADARINGNILAENMAVTSKGNTAVKSLTGMKSLDFCDDLTVERELGFAGNGQLNIKEERSDARILARNDAKIEIPKADLVWDAEGNYSNRLSIFEEVKDGKRPQIIFSGTPRKRAEIWPSFHLNYQKDAEEADENGWKPEYSMKCPSFVYVPKDDEGNPNWDEAVYGLIQLNNKVYQVEWDYGNGEGTSQIQLDGEACTLTNLKLKETEYNVSDIEEDLTGSDDIELIPYEASKMEEAANENPELNLNRDPYTDDSYGIDVFDEWNCEYQAEDEIAEYYVSGITDITDIVVLYGKWAGEGEERHYEGTSCPVYPIQQILHYVPDNGEFTADDEYTVEDGEKKYAMYYDFREEEKWVKNSHYVSDTLPGQEPVQEPISLADAGKIEITAPQAATYTGSAILGKPVVKRKSDSYVLVEGMDYTLGYQNNTNAGTASVTITAKDDSGYAGAQTVTFTISPKAVSGLTVDNVPNQTYTGNEIKPAISVSDGSNKLTADDYNVSYSQNTNIGKAKITITGKGNYTGTLAKDFTITVKKNASYTAGGYKYKIINAATNGKGTVSVTGLQKKTAKKIKIADTVTIGGVKFKITSIGKNAFKGCKKATDITIGKNVTSVGDNAFSGCTSLKKITVGKAVKTIGKSAFEKDSKLKSIKIQSTVLKKVGKNALKGIHKKAVVSVPKKQLKSYKKLLKGKGQASSVKIK